MLPSQDFSPSHVGILIADDDPVAIRLLRAALHDYSDVRIATNGRDALRLAQERPPDMILLDGEMPDESGLQVCCKLKQDPALQDVPVIFVTAHAQVEFETQAIRAGASDFIAKPISPIVVELRVKLHLQLKHRLDQLRLLAMTDALTQLPNRRAFDEVLAREWRRAQRNRQPLSLLLIDVDHFKRFNDHYGHPAGDECLRCVAAAVCGVARRPTDGCSRYGGEEFAMVLAETPLAGACVVADNLIAALARTAHPHATSDIAAHVTVSIGVSCTRSEGDPRSVPLAGASGRCQFDEQELVRAADRALYLAKQRGRNRVEAVALEDGASPRSEPTSGGHR